MGNITLIFFLSNAMRFLNIKTASSTHYEFQINTSSEEPDIDDVHDFRVNSIDSRMASFLTESTWHVLLCSGNLTFLNCMQKIHMIIKNNN